MYLRNITFCTKIHTHIELVCLYSFSCFVTLNSNCRKAKIRNFSFLFFSFISSLFKHRLVTDKQCVHSALRTKYLNTSFDNLVGKSECLYLRIVLNLNLLLIACKPLETDTGNIYVHRAEACSNIFKVSY